MTCATCHDPHRAAAELSVDHYRQRCVQCHGEVEGLVAAPDAGDERGRRPEAVATALCTRPDAATPAEAVTGDCAGCHMRRGGTSDVPHVSFTDHWIRRDPGPPRDPSLGRPAFEGSDPIELVALQDEGRPSWQLAPRVASTPLHQLEEAAAYWDFYETMHRHPSYPARVVARARAGLASGADRLDARIALGRALAEMDSAQAAERALQAAAAAYPDDPWVQFWLGSVVDEAGRPREAVAALRRAVELQPLLLEARVKLADALYRAGDATAALGELEAVVAADPVAWPRAWYNLGIIRQERGGTDAARAARAAFAEASRLDPDLLDAHVQLGTLLLADGRLDDAEAAFARAIVAAPTNVSALGSMAVLHLARADTARAVDRLRRVLELDPTNGPAQALLRQIGR
jgi:predicted CXXCH cytochrome family protein